MSDTPDPIPRVVDKRSKIAGLLPKNTQALVLGGVALLMTLVILFSGHNEPKAKPASPQVQAASITDPSQARIQDYRSRIEEQMRKLATEEAELAQTKAALGVNTARPDTRTGASQAPLYGPPIGGPPSGGPSFGQPALSQGETDQQSFERDRARREYQSRYSSNIALSYRRQTDSADAGSPIENTSTHGRHREEGANEASNAAAAPRQYRLSEGAILETVLTNRLDSSFSGPVNCMVTTNVYSHDGLKLLIPQGSRVLGEVKKLDSYGDQRLAVAFHRIVMPDGYSANLDQFKGLDQIGATGLRDQVNHHYVQIFGAAIAIGGIAGLSQANTRYSLDESPAQAYQQGVASSLSQSSLHILDRFLNVLPTFTIREGYRIKVYLAQDLMLPAVEDHPVRQDL